MNVTLNTTIVKGRKPSQYFRRAFNGFSDLVLPTWSSDYVPCFYDVPISWCTLVKPCEFSKGTSTRCALVPASVRFPWVPWLSRVPVFKRYVKTYIVNIAWRHEFWRFAAQFSIVAVTSRRPGKNFSPTFFPLAVDTRRITAFIMDICARNGSTKNSPRCATAKPIWHYFLELEGSLSTF